MLTPDTVAAFLLLAWPLRLVVGLERHRAVAAATIAGILGLVVVLLATGGLRWPLAPAMAVLVWWEIQAVNVALGQTSAAGMPRRRRGLVLAVLVAPVALLPTWLLPRAPALRPAGPYQVGVRDVVFRDPLQVGPRGEPRMLPVRFWYPGEPEPDPTAARRLADPRPLERRLTDALLPGWGPWVMRGLTRAPIAAAQEARLSTRQRGYRAVVLLYPRPGDPGLVAGLAMGLASRGFVVVVPDLSAAAPETIDIDIRLVQRGVERLAAPTSEGWLAGRVDTVRAGWVAVRVDPFSLDEDGATPALLAGTGALGGDGAPLGSVWSRLVMVTAGVPGDVPPDTEVVPLADAGPADLIDLRWWSPPLLRWTGRSGRVSPGSSARVVDSVIGEFLMRELPPA